MVYLINGEQLTRRKLVTIDRNMVTTQTDIPLVLSINLPRVKGAGADVRLAKLDGTPLAREIECTNTPNTDDVRIWYKWDTITSQDDQFYVYWGNLNLVEPGGNSTYGREAVWNDNYVGVYHMAQVPTGSITDSTLYGNNGTSSGSMTSNNLINEDYGKAIDFDGIDDKISVDGIINDLDLTLTGGVTFEIRMKYNYNSGYQLNGLCVDGASNNYLEIANDNGIIRGEMKGSGGSPARVTATTSATTTIFQSFTCIKNGEDLYIYINGIEEDSDTTTGLSGTINVTDADIGWEYSNTYATNARISEVKYSKTVRSANWLLTTYLNLNNPTNSGSNPFYKSFGFVQHQRKIPQIIG